MRIRDAQGVLGAAERVRLFSASRARWRHRRAGMSAAVARSRSPDRRVSTISRGFLDAASARAADPSELFGLDGGSATGYQFACELGARAACRRLAQLCGAAPQVSSCLTGQSDWLGEDRQPVALTCRETLARACDAGIESSCQRVSAQQLRCQTLRLLNATLAARFRGSAPSDVPTP